MLAYDKQSSYATWFVATPKVDAILARKQGEMRYFKIRLGDNEVNSDVLGVYSEYASHEVILAVCSTEDQDARADLYGPVPHSLICLDAGCVKEAFQIADFIFHTKKMTYDSLVIIYRVRDIWMWYHLVNRIFPSTRVLLLPRRSGSTFRCQPMARRSMGCKGS